MKSTYSTQNSKNKKIIEAIDKDLNEIEKDVSYFFKIKGSNDFNNNTAQKKVSSVVKILSHLLKILFDPKIINEELFDYFMERNVLKLLIDYICLQDMSLVNGIFPFLHKILFESNHILQKINLNEEILLMNSSVIISIKILIKTFISILDQEKALNFIEDHMISFIYILNQKLAMYPNFYYSIHR